MSDTPRTDAAVEFITKQLREEPSICADHPYYVLDIMKHEGMKVERELAAAKAENEALREALKQIASCTSHHKGDVVDIARAALAKEKS
jgi:acetolactate synthase small subunit